MNYYPPVYGFNFINEGCLNMKILSIAAGIALALSANVATAQDNAGGAGAADSTIGGMDKDKVVAGTAGLLVLGAVIANNRGSVAQAPVVIIDPECGPGEELVGGECVPVDTTPTVTTTVTSTVTATMTTPVTVTATTTTL